MSATQPLESTPPQGASAAARRQAEVLALAFGVWGLVYWRLAAVAGWLTTVALGLSRQTAIGSAASSRRSSAS